MAAEFKVPRELLAKYEQAGPRYTSYPTVPEWSAAFGEAETREAIRDNGRERAGFPLSLYIHIPFCAKLCFYCGCNIHLTRDEALVERYINALDREIGSVADQIGTKRPVVQIHWGGGTPTHLDPDQLERVYHLLSSRFKLAKAAEVSLEVHPAVTSDAQLERLAKLGFNRISMGVQDFDPVVQRAVNRIQPYEATHDLVSKSRELGFQSVNLDLMYGLPFQTLVGFEITLAKVMKIRPDRIALFNYAHLPALFPHQKGFKELPDAALKLDLLEQAIATFMRHGYQYIGMDHFALPENELARAKIDQSLRRNFMGYTTCADSDLFSFGMSAISDLDGAFFQNERKLEGYFEAIEAGRMPVCKGMILSADDKLRRDVIYTLICHGYLDKRAIAARHAIDFDATFATELAELGTMRDDRLITLTPDAIRVESSGQLLIRNLCMPFDAYLRRRPAESRPFSRTI